jgi:hypothetical protein
MAILTTDLVFFGSASRVSDDTSTTGGAIDLTDRPEFTQFSAAARPEVVSDGADTRNVTIEGRNAAGAIITETNALNGTTPVLFAATYERILTVTIASSSGTRIVLVKEGASGTTRVTIGLNETSRTAMFRRSASAAGIVIRYVKVFGRNGHATLTLNSAAVKLTADPDARIRIGLPAAINDTATIANRVTAPASVSFVDDNVSQGVPGGVLAAGDKIGVWVEQNLPANDPARKSTATLELSGTST